MLLSLRVCQVIGRPSCPWSKLPRVEVQVLARSCCASGCGCSVLAPILLAVTSYCRTGARLDAEMVLLVVICIARSTVAWLVLE